MTASDWLWTIILLGLTVLISWLFNRDDRDGDDDDDM